jgi:two-component system phosphate regulon sensor histidine kinase PhoR
VPVEFVLVVAAAALVAGAVGGWWLRTRRPVPPATAARPVTQSIAADTVPRQGTDELAGLLERIDLGVVRLGADQRVMRVNRAAARMLRVEQDAAAGRSPLELFVDHRVADAVAASRGQEPATIEISLDGQNESAVVLRIRPAVGGAWLLLEDVTELRRLQRIRSEFIDNLSHELRTPLTTIRLLTETLNQDLERGATPARIEDKVKKIDVETGHLVQMVNELLDLSRIEGGAARLHLEPVDLADLVRGALDRLRTFAERQQVSLASTIEPELPRVAGDLERLDQLLVNLLHNAIKFSPPGAHVTVGAQAADGVVTVTVADEGMGIPAADLDRVFERFYKVDKARQRGMGGTGLGLSIARHIVEGHGGRIWVESEEGRGATFFFTLPADGDHLSG